MNEFIRTSQIAATLKISVQAVNQRVVREKWIWQKKSGRGGGREYPFATLPTDVQAALLKAESQQILAESPLSIVPRPAPMPVDPTVKAAGDAKAAHLHGKLLARMDARLTALRLFVQYVRSQPFQLSNARPDGTLARQAFCVAWNTGQMDVPEAVRQILPRISDDSLIRWRTSLARAGLAAVAGRYGHRRNENLIERQPQLAAALKALIVEQPHATARFAHEWLTARYEGGGLQLPGLKTVSRWLERWKTENASLYCLISNPDEWKNKFMVAWGDASAHVIALNQEWQADSSPADLELMDGRHSIIALIDVYSRRLKLHISKTSTAAAIASILRRGLVDWGVPDVLKTDNGHDYTAHHIVRICDALKIERQTCAPFSPYQKGFVERVIKSFAHDLVPYLPGYIGHNVSEREALRARDQFSDRLFVKNSTVSLKLTAVQLQEFADRWCESYHQRPHRGLDGATPHQRVMEWTEPTRGLPDERILDVLLAPAPSGDGWRVVSKDGGVKVEGYEYVAVELALHVRERVRVLFDPEGDLGKVVVFNDKGAFIAVAECMEVTGRNRNDLAAQARAVQAAHTQEQKRLAKSESRKALKGRAAVELVDAHRLEKARALPTPADANRLEHSTPHIEGAAEALTGQTEHCGSGFTPQEARALGYFDPLPALPPEPPTPPASVTVFDSPFAAMRDLFHRAMKGQQRPGDAAFTADFYAEHRKPHLFENEMIEQVGWETFYAWKIAMLEQAKTESAAASLHQATG